STRRAIVRHRKRYCIGDVLDVAACPTPSRAQLLEKNPVPAIVHSLQILESSMIFVARPVDRRQSQDRRAKVWRARNYAFDVSLLVSRCKIARTLGDRAMGILALSKRRVLS